MQEKKNKKSGLFSIFNDSIQLRFYRRENFEQIGSLNLSPRSIYIILSSSIFVLLLLVFALLAFTPLQRLIPRLSSIENSQKFIELNNTLNEIDAEIGAQDVYLNAVRKMIVGEEKVDIGDIEIVALNQNLDQNDPPKREAVVLRDFQEEEKLELETGSIFDDMESVEFFAPLEGIISADFEPQLQHFGVDIIAPTNTPVRSIRSGHIIIAEWNIETGHTIGVQHDNNILSFYKHNSVLLKEKGNFVKAGEVIAIIGNSGRLTNGPHLHHLHFEMWHNGKPVNPNDYINLKNE